MSLILTEAMDGYLLVRLNRPQALNALNLPLLQQLANTLAQADADDAIKAVLICGSEKAFAAGADIGEIAAQQFPQSYAHNFLAVWEAVRGARKPRIAAVEGYALGGGCELTLLCDIVIAGDKAVFGQPEITLNLLPGAGGSQLLPRRVGMARAADWCLTGRMVPAAEALQAGLVSRVVAAGTAETEAGTVAAQLAQRSIPTLLALTESLRSTESLAANSGIMYERRLFQSLLGTPDVVAGTTAFLNKKRAAV
jgi:enoyl-CoA hydratase